MLASQLIYTGCGKDKTGGFSVWSKSSDITMEEEKSIVDTLRYPRTGPNLPLRPTFEEIEALFPRKVAYFKLPSGRMCLGQSCYVGQKYSDVDNRFGNNIIHAFVFDETDEIVPMNFVGSDFFKRFLTYEEWHDNDAPDSLPKIDVPADEARATVQECASFFKDKKDALKQFIQACLNALSDERKITFNDKRENLKYWYKAICTFVPKSKYKELTFNTNFSFDVSTADAKIRNVASDVTTGSFSYPNDARAGKYSFDFEKNLLPTGIEVTKYVNGLIEEFIVNPFGAIMMSEEVGKVAIKSGLAYDNAMELYQLLSGRFSVLGTISLIESTLNPAISFYNEELSQIADGLYDYVVVKESFPFSKEARGLYSFIMKYSKAIDKNLFVKKYITNVTAFGVSNESKPEEYYNAFFANAPFEKGIFEEYIRNNPLNFISSANQEYLVFSTIFDNIASVVGGSSDGENLKNYLINTIKHHIKSEAMNSLQLLLARADKCGPKWRPWLIKNAYSRLVSEKGSLSSATNYNFTFLIAEICNDSDLSVEYITTLIKENEKNSAFVNAFINRSDANKAFYMAINSTIQRDSEFTAFINKIELTKLSRTTTVTYQMLNEYYDKYYITGKERTLFSAKLQQYLDTYKDKSLILESIRCFDSWFKDMDPEIPSVIECAGIIAKKIFSVNIVEIKEFTSQEGTARIESVLKVAERGDFQRPNKYKVLKFGQAIISVTKDAKIDKMGAGAKSALDALSKGTFYGMIASDAARDDFCNLYLTETIKLYMVLSMPINFDEVFKGIYEPLQTLPSFKKNFLKALGSVSKDEKLEEFISNAIICLQDNKIKHPEIMKKIIFEYFDSMAAGDRKKLIKKLETNCAPKFERAISTFIKEYNGTKKGFLGRLFDSLFGGSKEEKK